MSEEGVPRRSDVYSAAPSDRTEVAVPRSGTAGSRSAVPPDKFQLERFEDGGFRFVHPQGRALTARPSPEGLRLDAGLLRRRTDVTGGGYLLEAGGEGDEAIERGRTMRAARGARTVDGVTILLDDGRLFEVRSALESGVLGFELAGWEVSGAYARAEAEGRGWALWLTPAGSALDGSDTVLLLFAAELAAASGPEV